MLLLSSLFEGDEKLEAAAAVDSAHVLQSAKGPHVEKIQLALIILDDAKLVTDGAYGPSTAAAVRAYKQKRGIINTAYQTTPDDIVGKMTVVAMDRELVNHQRTSPPLAHIEVVLPPNPTPFLFANPLRIGLTEIHLALKAKGIGKSSKDFLDLPLPPFGPRFSTQFMELSVAQTGVFRVEGGKGGILGISDTRLAFFFDPSLQNAHGNFVAVYKDRMDFVVKALHPGSCDISLKFPASAQKTFIELPTFLHLKIRFTSDEKDFTPGASPHNHEPCRDWEKVKAHPNSSIVSSDTPEGGDGLVTVIGAPFIGAMVRNSNSPKDVVDRVLTFPFGPIAREHLNHYLHSGGRDFVEDDNIRQWLLFDDGIRKRLAREIKSASQTSSSKLIRGHFFFEQGGYENDDFLNSFGAIDRVDYEADLTGGTLTVWFQDRYEWHPNYPGLYTNFPDDDLRFSNGIHAAFVEMKTQGAADFWMKGESTVGMV